jgi:hypothetical protein
MGEGCASGVFTHTHKHITKILTANSPRAPFNSPISHAASVGICLCALHCTCPVSMTADGRTDFPADDLQQVSSKDTALQQLQRKWGLMNNTAYIRTIANGLYLVKGCTEHADSKNTLQFDHNEHLLTIVGPLDGQPRSQTFPFCSCRREFYHELMYCFEAAASEALSPLALAEKSCPQAVCLHMKCADQCMRMSSSRLRVVDNDIAGWIRGAPTAVPCKLIRSGAGIVVWGGTHQLPEVPLPARVTKTRRGKLICSMCRLYDSGRTHPCRHVRCVRYVQRTADADPFTDAAAPALQFSDDDEDSADFMCRQKYGAITSVCADMEGPLPEQRSPAWRSTLPIPRFGPVDKLSIRSVRCMHSPVEAALRRPLEERFPALLAPHTGRCVCGAGAMLGKHSLPVIMEAAGATISWWERCALRAPDDASVTEMSTPLVGSLQRAVSLSPTPPCMGRHAAVPRAAVRMVSPAP